MLAALIPLIIPALGKILDKVIPGDSEKMRLRKMEIEAALVMEMSKANMGQMEINKVEAASDSIFKSGWRPAVAWLGVFALAVTFLNPIITYILNLYGLPELPKFNTQELTTILMSLLGLGGYRTYEKFKKVSK